jgi:hypothetical protein
VWGEEIPVVPEPYVDLREHTLMFHVLRGRGNHSGADVTMPVAQVVRRRDGLMVYLKVYVQTRDALNDLGVAEDKLEPIDP